MTYHVIMQPQAEAEIEAAYLWKRDNAPQAAARWFAGIVEVINSLDGLPTAFPKKMDMRSAHAESLLKETGL